MKTKSESWFLEESSSIIGYIVFFLLSLGFCKGIVVIDPNRSTLDIPQNLFSNSCDYANGEWIYDKNRPSYKSCPFIRPAFNCRQNGRVDLSYEKWSWKPFGCLLPKFSAAYFLKRFHNKKVAIIGDSISTDFGESLVCQLSKFIKITPIKKHLKGGIFVGYGSSNFGTQIFLVNSPFLTAYSNKASDFQRFGLHQNSKQEYIVFLDSLDPKWSAAVHEFDLLVFMSAHWYLVDNPASIVSARYFVRNGKLSPTLSTYDGYKTALNLLRARVLPNTKKGSVSMYMTDSPAHYVNKQCQETAPKSYKEASLYYNYGGGLVTKELRGAEASVFAGTQMKILDVSFMASFRQDAHVKLNYGKDKKGKNGYDCLHWCLPGVPDTFVDVFQFKLRQS